MLSSKIETADRLRDVRQGGLITGQVVVTSIRKRGPKPPVELKEDPDGRCEGGGAVRQKRAPARHVGRIANGRFISLRELV